MAKGYDWSAFRKTYGVTKKDLKYVGKGIVKHASVARDSGRIRGIGNMPPGGGKR